MPNDDPFTGPQLQNSEFVKANMKNTCFDGVNLDGAKFFAVLNKALFRSSNMTSAEFHDVNLSYADFDDVNISNARINNANLRGLEITDSMLDGMKINGILVSDLIELFQTTKTNND